MDEREANIISKLKKGEEETYIWLFREYFIPLCAYAKRYLGRKDLAEEIVSETFFNIWRNRINLDIHISLKSYLFQAVCNNSLNFLRKSQKEEKLEDYSLKLGNEINPEDRSSNQQPLEYLINKNLSQEIHKAVNKLPRQQQTVFRLKRFEGKKNKEIARILGISEKTVEMHFHNASSKMKEFLKDYFDDLMIFILMMSFIN